MAEENINDLNNSAEDIKVNFAEIRNLVEDLNKNLASTVQLTSNVVNNLAQTNDIGKKQVKDDEKKEGILKNVDKLKDKSKTKELALNKIKQAGNRIIDELLVQMMAADKEVNSMSKSLNISYDEATALKQEFALAAAKSGDLAVNSVRMGKAMGTLNEQLGSAFRFTDEMLMTTSKLTEVVGLSAEAAGSLAFQAQRSGQSVREVEENALGASYAMQQSAGIALDMKGVLEATGKVSGQLRAQLGGNPEVIAKAVTAAKLLGAEIADIANSSKQLLDFETSIEDELQAELLTGKQLNLERARAAALAGDQETVAKELAANMGTFTDFTKMNTLQQDALAKSMGMQSDQLADMLFKQETMGMNAKQLRAQGKDELADRLEQLDAQDKMALAQEKMTALMGDLATIFLPIVEGFGNLISFIMESKLALAGLVGIMTAFAAVSIASSIAQIMGSFGLIPFGIGVPLGIAAVAGLLATIGTGIALVKDGIAPSSKGPFTIMDNYGGMAKTTPGDNLQVSPNVGKSSGTTQPIVIKNTFDAFAASNGNGRKGLGGTQEMQASPTFA